MPGWHAGTRGMRQCKKKRTDDRYFLVSFIVTYNTEDSSTPIMFEKTFVPLPFAGKNASRVLCLYLPFGAFLDLDLQKHTAEILFTSKEQASYSKRMQPSLSFVLYYDTSSSWIFRKTEQRNNVLAVMFLTLFALDIIYFTFFPIIVCAQTCLK